QYVTVTHYTNIYYGAFQNCVKIVGVTIELSDVGSIVNETETASINNGYLVGAYAFKNCTELSAVSFADVLTEIGDNAFVDCINLTQITIPVHVEKIGSCAFANTQKLRDINFNAEHCADFQEDDDVFLDAGIMQSGVTLTVGNAVRRLPAYFYRTSKESQLKEIKMVNVASASLAEIGRYAFCECEKLTSITLPGTITEIGQDAFYHTGYYNTQSNWRECALYYINSAYKYLLAFNNEIAQSTYVVLDDTLVIANAAFAQSTVLTDVTLPMSIVTVGADAFMNCAKLQSVTFRVNDLTKLSALTTIGAAAFKNCGALYSVRITGNVTSIGDQAFDGCRLLKTVYIDSEEISNSVSTESAAGYLCNHADKIYVQKDIALEKTGTYIRTRYTSSQGDVEDDYKIWTKK
ncbi:MAG: leucine-rich repeat domain-containing protein, partial [Clostridia bacterium]|nr:leucine-rich repeat domain-containing protein [Clostridia bacterium]